MKYYENLRLVYEVQTRLQEWSEQDETKTELRRERKEMNCANHPETAAIAYCRTCGKPLCQICQRPAQGTVFCEEHSCGCCSRESLHSPAAVSLRSPLCARLRTRRRLDWRSCSV